MEYFIGPYECDDTNDVPPDLVAEPGKLVFSTLINHNEEEQIISFFSDTGAEINMGVEHLDGLLSVLKTIRNNIKESVFGDGQYYTKD